MNRLFFFRRAKQMTETIIKAPKISKTQYKKYRGKHVALYHDKIIAEGNNSAEALQKALKKHPDLKPQQIELYYIQIANNVVF